MKRKEIRYRKEKIYRIELKWLFKDREGWRWMKNCSDEEESEIKIKKRNKKNSCKTEKE